MACIALVLCVLVLRCGLAGVVWYPDAGFKLYNYTNKHNNNNNNNNTLTNVRPYQQVANSKPNTNSEIKKHTGKSSVLQQTTD